MPCSKRTSSGWKVAACLLHERRARALISADEQEISLNEAFGTSGVSPQEANATERALASQQSAAHYIAIQARDIQLAYASGVLWLAFGFAVALTQRNLSLPNPSPATLPPC